VKKYWIKIYLFFVVMVVIVDIKGVVALFYEK